MYIKDGRLRAEAFRFRWKIWGGLQKLKVAHSKTKKTSCDIQVEGVWGNNANTSVGSGGLKSSHASALTRVSFLWLPLHHFIKMSPVLTCLLFSPSPPLAPCPRPRLQYLQVWRAAWWLLSPRCRPGQVRWASGLAGQPNRQLQHPQAKQEGLGWEERAAEGCYVVSCVVFIYNFRAFSLISYKVQNYLRRKEIKLYKLCKEENYSLKFNPGGCILAELNINSLGGSAGKT